MSGGVWMASYVALWAAVAVLLVMVLALVRQIGVLHGRLDEVESGAGGFGIEEDEARGDRASGRADGSGRAGGAAGEPLSAAEGPPLGSTVPMGNRIGFERSPLTLVAFTSASCELSQVLVPALRIVDKQYDDVRVVELPLGPRTIAAFEAFNVLHTPFVVAVGQDGRVRGRGRARNLQQLEAFVERALAVAAKAAGRAAGVAGAGAGAGAGAESPAASASSAARPDAKPSPELADTAAPATGPQHNQEPAPAEPAEPAAAPAVTEAAVDGAVTAVANSPDDAEPVVELEASHPDAAPDTVDDAARAGV